MHHPSVSRHIIPLKFSNWNIKCFAQKESINIQFFRLLSALMKVHPLPRVIFETTRSGFIQVLRHFSVMKDNSSVLFLAQTLYTLDKKSPCPHKISPNLYFERTFLLKIYKTSTKKVQRIYVSWHWRVMQNLKDN